MGDRTINQRIKKQRDARTREGWQEVRVWVPTREDADKVLKFSANLRAKALEFDGLDKLEGVKKLMCSNNFIRTMEAVATQGSIAYTTPSGPVLTLLTELAEEGHLVDVANAFIIFARAHPLNAPFVAKSVAAKILNGYICRRVGISAVDFLRWETSHTDWADKLENQLRQPHLFEHTINEIITELAKKYD